MSAHSVVKKMDKQRLHSDYRRRGDFMELRGTDSGSIHSFKKHLLNTYTVLGTRGPKNPILAFKDHMVLTR